MQDVAEFLAAHPPFDALDRSDVIRLAAAAELERTPGGAEIFQQICAGCHGAKGQGQYGKKLNEGAVLQSIPNKADEVTVVQNGRGLMPSFKDTLTPEQIAAVVDFTRTGLQTAS